MIHKWYFDTKKEAQEFLIKHFVKVKGFTIKQNNEGKWQLRVTN